MILDQVAQYLHDNNIGTYADNGTIYVGNLPEQPTNAIMLVTVPSPSPSVDLPTESLSFEVWSRNESTVNGYAKLREVHRLLHRKGNYALPSYYVFATKSTDAIVDMDQDLQGRKLQKLPMQILYRDLQITS